MGRYPLTDGAVATLSSWPVTDKEKTAYFETKESFQNYINRHRYQLDSLGNEEKDELWFYTDMIDRFMRW